MLNMPERRFALEEATVDAQVVTVPYPDKTQEDIDGLLSDRFGDELQRAGVPAIFAPRILAASRRTVGEIRQARPFDRPGADVTVLERLTKGVAAVEKADEAVLVSPISQEEQALRLQRQLKTYAGWWEKNGDSSVSRFQADINESAGIPSGGRERASPEQLCRASDYAKRRISAHCMKTGKKPPRSTE